MCGDEKKNRPTLAYDGVLAGFCMDENLNIQCADDVFQR